MQKPAAILDPTVSKVEEGLRIRLRPDRSDRDGCWTLDLRLELAHLQRPIPVVEVPSMMGLPVSVQTPFFGCIDLETTAELVEERVLLLVGPDPTSRESGILALVGMRQLTSADATPEKEHPAASTR